jgi:hypothetical protein
MPKQIKKQTVVKKKETKPKEKPNLSWWKEHCKWLDSFRGKIITKNGE